MTRDLSRIPTAELRAEINRRLARQSPKPKTLKPCQACGKLLGARERRQPCPACGARNPR